MLKLLATFSGFSVNNIDEAKKFYVDLVGLTLENETMGLRFQLPNGGTVFVYQKDDHVPAAYTVLNFVVANIDDAIDQLVGKGVVFERYENMPAPQDERGVLRGIAANQGPDIAWFKDPAGNILSLLQEK